MLMGRWRGTGINAQSSKSASQPRHARLCSSSPCSYIPRIETSSWWISSVRIQATSWPIIVDLYPVKLGEEVGKHDADGSFGDGKLAGAGQFQAGWRAAIANAGSGIDDPDVLNAEGEILCCLGRGAAQE